MGGRQDLYALQGNVGMAGGHAAADAILASAFCAFVETR
jgi:hypothetical protein